MITCQPDRLYLREQVMWGSVVILRNQKGSARKRVWETHLQRLLLNFLKICWTPVDIFITLHVGTASAVRRTVGEVKW